MTKRGQVTIFVIIAIILVVGVVGYFLLKDRINISGVSKEFEPVYNYYLSCIEEEAESASMILGEKGGYIYLPEFEPGSSYRPFSSQLDFFGSGIPYWYYIAGNNIIKEQVPSKSNMQRQMNEYLAERIEECNFDDFEKQGYLIDIGEASVSSKITDNQIEVSVNMPLTISFADESVRVVNHQVSINSKLGKFYNLALDIYNKEKKEAFLENYAVDVLRLYAPVDGVELTCAPKVWLKQDIDKELKEALEANMQAIKFSGESSDYFVQDLNVGEDVQFLYSKNWPTRLEISGEGADEELLIAEPVGLQQGLGILGFCYVPYHYVYDINYPVLVQIYNENELFQFPLAVIIEKNMPRESLPASFIDDLEPELCKYKNTKVDVYTYNTNLEPVEADIDFTCLQQTCDIGKTEIESNEAKLEGLFPQCVNGYVIAKAEGYAEKKYLESTISEGITDIILDKLYELDVDFKVDSKNTNDNAIITFSSSDNTQTILWPEQKTIKLSEGFYNISVYVFRDSSIPIPAMKKEQCAEVSKSGILGFFGQTEEKCFDLDLPSQTLSNVISGGGDVEEYITEMQLEKGEIEINAPSISLPRSLEELQDSYILLENNVVYIDFS